MEHKLSFIKSLTAGFLAAITAVIVNAILFLTFHAAGIIADTVFIKPNTPMGLAPVIIMSFVPTLIASMIFFLLEKYTNKGFKIFAIVSVVLLVLSFLDPFLAIPGVTMGYALVLDFMHIVVVAALLFFINKSKNNNKTRVQKSKIAMNLS